MICFSVSAEALQKSPWNLTGAIQGSFQHLSYNSKRQGVFEFGAVRAAIAYDDGMIIGSGQLNYYHYSHRVTGGTDSGNMLFLQQLWAGFRFDDKSELKVGLHSQPFGLSPYAGNNFFESMAYYAGYEDTQSFGLSYSRKDGELETQLSFYPQDGGYGWASVSKGNELERESTRYSFHAVNGNTEYNTGIARIVYGISHDKDNRSEIGLSYLNGRIKSTINQAGKRDAFAVHYAGKFDKLGVKLQAIHYDYQLNGSPTTLLVGAFGYSNKLVTHGTIYMANISYLFEGTLGPFNSFTLYNDYSVLEKNERGFSNSIQNVTGISFAAGQFWVYVDYMLGKNSPYMSPVFYNGLGTGAVTDNTGQRLHINIGYYF